MTEERNTNLDKIKRRLGIPLDDTTEDDLLADLIEDAESYFLGLTGEDEVESAYAYMIRNVVVKMYARKGSEAVSSEKVDGYWVTYESWGELFNPYMDILNRDFGLNEPLRERGEVVFL